MIRTRIKIVKMDCPSEIKMIEGMVEKLDPQIKTDFDLSERIVTFFHEIDKSEILEGLQGITLPGEIVSSEQIDSKEVPELGPSVEAKTLIYLLAINLTMFFVEVFCGYYAESTGLIADGLDMLADAMVYGVSLYAVGKSVSVKNRTAFLSGMIEISLGLLCLVQVGRKFYFGSEPISSFMISVSIIAFAANILCLALIHKHKDGEVHMKASWIFSANDVIVNAGVILSGILVFFFQSNIPDLLVGTIVSLVVIRGGFVIIKISKPAKKVEASN